MQYIIILKIVFCPFLITYPVISCTVYCCMQVNGVRGLGGYLKRAFQGNTEVYWLPKAGGKESPAARQLVLFTFSYGDTRKKQAHTTAGNHQDEKLRLWAFPPLLYFPCTQKLSWHSLLFARVNVSFSVYSSHFLRIKALTRHVL